MSGSIRQQIGPVKARLMQYLKNGLLKLDTTINTKDAPQEQEKKLLEIRQEVMYELKRIEKAVNSLETFNTQWLKYIDSLEGEEKETEAALYTKTSDPPTGFVEIMMQGKEKVSELETIICDIDKRIEILHIPRKLPAENAAVTMSVPQPMKAPASSEEPTVYTTTTLTTGTTTSATTMTTSVYGPGWQPITSPHMTTTAPVSSTPVSLPISYMQYIPGIQSQMANMSPITQQQMHSTPVAPLLPNTQMESTMQSPQMQPMPVKLHKMELPMFHGDSLEWKGFWDVFSYSVHNQPIPNVQKFGYLIGLLKGEAKEAIQGISVTNENYIHAVEILQKRFGNIEIIKDTLYSKLRNLSFASNKMVELRQTMNIMDKILRQLSALNEDINHPSVVRQLLEKLSAETLTELERSKGPYSQWNVQMLRESLWNYIEMKERVSRLSSNMSKVQFNNFHGKSYKGKAEQKKTTGSMSNFAKKNNWNNQKQQVQTIEKPKGFSKPNRPCIFCDGEHFQNQCKKYSTVEAREKRLFEKKCCFRCLKPGHIIKDCRLQKKPCRHCKKMHNQALCPEIFGPKSSNGNKTTMSNQVSIYDGSNLMKQEVKAEAETNAVAPKVGEANVNQSVIHSRDTRLLTAKSIIMNPDDESKNTAVKLFFDSGSQRSFITEETANKIALTNLGNESLTIHTFAAKKPQYKNSKLVQFMIPLKDGSTMMIQANAIKGPLTNEWDKQTLQKQDMEILHQISGTEFADDLNDEQVNPDILIGLDYFWKIINGKKGKELPSGLSLISTELGLMIGGKQYFKCPEENGKIQIYTIATNTSMNQSMPCINQYAEADQSLALNPNIEDLWSLESIGITDSPKDNDDEIAMGKFNSSIKFTNGRYAVTWPWKNGDINLPDNYGLAMGRFRSLAKRFEKDPELLGKYATIINEQIQKGIIEPVNSNSITGTRFHYLPHQPVITPQKTTTKVRIVYDGSSRQNKNDNSLNQCLYRGPIMLPDLAGILLRFRLQPIALTGDIEKAFLMLDLQVQDRDVTRFIWYKDATNPKVENNVQIYRFQRVPFGVISSPFLLNATIKHHLTKEDSVCSKLIRENIYVDNVVLGAETEEEAITLYKEGKRIFNEIGMNLREWTSNNKSFNESIDSCDRVDGNSAKVLGLKWDRKKDEIHIPITQKVIVGNTKRMVLQTIASIFDPLGFFSPIVLPGKVFLQELWQKKIEWDETLPPELISKWKSIVQNMERIHTMPIPRYVGLSGEDADYQLMVFTDASAKAYGMTAYLRITVCNVSKVQLIFSKSKLCPKGGMSLPRLELLGILIGTRAIKFLRTELHVPISDTILWTDSEVCLHWIKSPKTLSVFVENRLKKITKIPDITFKYIQTKENPADLVTRGILADADFSQNKLWWNGPDWLSMHPSSWPTWNLPEITPKIIEQVNSETRKGNPIFEVSTVSIEPNETDYTNNDLWKPMIECSCYTGEECTNGKCTKLQYLPYNRYYDTNIESRESKYKPQKNGNTCDIDEFTKVIDETWADAVIKVTKEDEFPINPTRFSSWNKLNRTTAYVLRMLHEKIWKKLSMKTQEKFPLLNKILSINENGPIKTNEMHNAQYLWQYQIQRNHFPELFDKKLKLPKQGVHQLLKHLNVKVGQDGLAYCYGRLTMAEQLLASSITPILLPTKCYVTKLIIEDTHKKLFHSGIQQTLAEIRKQYWIPRGRSEVKRVLKPCVICQKYNAGPFPLPPMAPLPKDRINKAYPFQYVGLDYLGPLKVKMEEETKKVWICLYTCMVTRAIHLEVVTDLSTNSFIDCLRRFIAKRGKPSTITSDNATTFKLADKTLQKAWTYVFESSDVINYCASQQITWRFITEYAPWHGGFYERLVGLTKNCLKKAIGRKILQYDHFLTFCAEVEAVINSRPLTYTYNEIESKEILRPVDFLQTTGQVGTPMLEEDHTDPEYLPKLDSADKALKYWRSSQQNLDHFWKLWNDEYLLSLRESHNIMHKQPHHTSNVVPENGDIVLIKEENIPRSSWKVGRISNLLPSKDGEIRAAKLLLSNSQTITRPINHLYPLEIPKETPQKKETTQAYSSTSIKFPYISKVFLLLMISFLVGRVAGKICDSTAPHTKIESMECVSKGIVVMKAADSTLCYQIKTCPMGHLDGEGNCGQKCNCPKWSKSCSFYKGPMPKIVGDLKTILSFAKPSFCSLKPDKRCSNKSTNMRLNQIKLYDGTLHYVKEMNIQIAEATSDEYECTGDGTVVGSAEFCSNHDCASSGTKFCYYKKNDIAYFVTNEGKIPIKAWGSVPVKVYGIKEAPPQNPLCIDCELQCIKAGIKVSLSENMGMMEVCVKPVCYKISNPSTEEKIIFPAEISLTKHEFYVKVWANGYLVKNMGIQCNADPFCEQVNCYLCWERIGNPDCTPKTMLLFIFMMIYFSSISIYIFIKLAKYCFKSTYFCAYATYKCTRLIMRFCRRARNKAYEKMYLPVYAMVNKESNEDDNSSNSSEENLQLIQIEGQRRSYNPSARINLTTTVSIVCAIIFLSQLQIGQGCSEFTSLTAQRSVCTVDKQGGMECLLTETTRLALVPQGQDSCLLVKDPNGEPLGTLAIEVEKISLECQMKSEYFTRSFQMKHEASKRCSSKGSCQGKKCGEININSKIPELEGEPNNSPGFTYCLESCGCAGCGCGWCTSGCLFYRVYVVPTSDTVYELFSCPTWEYKIEATARLTLQGESSQNNVVLRPGKGVTWGNLKMTLVSVTSPPVPVLGSKFLTDGSKTIMVQASESGQPITGTLGELQCKDKNSASKFDCYYPKDTCKCQGQEDKVQCSCNSMNIESLFNKIEHVIPMHMQGISIIGTGTKIEAEYNSIASLELQISLDGFRLSSKVEKNLCHIKPLGFAGCYGCLTGAKLDFKCKTDFGEALAHVVCGEGTFSTVCTPEGVTATATMQYSQAIVKEECTVSCPAGITKFNIKANLVYIKKERLGNITNMIAGKNINDGMNGFDGLDFGFLSGWLSGNWLAGIIIIICVILLLIITIPLAPYLLQKIIDGMSNFKCSARKFKKIFRKKDK